jgi:competence protein ComEA
VLLRSRPDGRLAAERVAALLPAAPGGWLPPDEIEPAPEPEAEPGPEPERSWSGRGGHALDSERWRLDPGRRGAVALVVVALLAALVAGAVALRARPQEVPVPVVEAGGVPLPGVSPTAGPEGGEVVVSVAGKVRSPGLVRLPAGSRVDDAVRAAGGPVEGADTGLLNLARRLVDGEQVLVGVDPPPGSAPAGSGAGSALLDLNAASASDLDALPGIGPVLAQRIVDWRAENGRFASVDQLREVTGIGEAKFQDLQAKVTV